MKKPSKVILFYNHFTTAADLVLLLLIKFIGNYEKKELALQTY